MGPYNGFRIFSTIASIFLTGVICYCHPLGYASFDENKSNQPRRFLAN